MNKTIIETSGLTKCYGTFVALDHVCLQLYENEIYGLIGRNGAGKTTLMRSLSGLSIPTSGRILLFGKEQAKLLPAERRNIGCMIEHPGIIPYLTAKENLQLHQILRGLKKTNCKTELELVGLDEPINGLDPLGVIQIRRLLTDLCHKKHITILISSHNMHELYQVATKYLFLDRGKVVKSVSSDELDQERSLENFFLSLIGGEHHA